MFAAKKLNQLSEDAIRVLMGIEQGMRRFEFVPVNHIAFFARFDKEKTKYLLDKVHKLGVVYRFKGINRGDPISYILNYEGYDILALHAFYSKNIIKSIGNIRGKGKESDVYECLLFNGDQAIIKFHRLGRISFRNIKKLRSYITKQKHLNWLYMSRLSAHREYEALNLIQSKNLDFKVPKVYGWNRHAIVLSLLYGDELYKFNEINEPVKIFEEILDQYYKIYTNVGIIHGDLGEFNVILSPNNDIMIIDWPQWVSKDHPHAQQYLKRDIENITEFFKRKYKLEIDVDSILYKFLKSEFDK